MSIRLLKQCLSQWGNVAWIIKAGINCCRKLSNEDLSCTKPAKCHEIKTWSLFNTCYLFCIGRSSGWAPAQANSFHCSFWRQKLPGTGEPIQNDPAVSSHPESSPHWRRHDVCLAKQHFRYNKRYKVNIKHNFSSTLIVLSNKKIEHLHW